MLEKDNDPGLTKDGTEAQLQQWLFENPEVIGEGFVAVEREFNTGAGAVDLLLLSPDGEPVAVEVKRVAMLGAVDQIQRYVESMKTLEPVSFAHPVTHEHYVLDFKNTRGLVAALDLRPKMLQLAEKRGVPSVIIPAYWRTERNPESGTAITTARETLFPNI